ncbi:DUF6653 family protein [Nonomuraea spiralis]|uniref:DUF6653 family protein n=1 Tax=Nonomuraea spiralis TaxID=46182 RepID=UPI00379D423A
MKLTQAAAATFGLNDDSWKRHANAWSVWTRMAGLAPILLPIYFRDALGWWAPAPIVAGVIWMWLNPHAFKPVYEPRSWAEKGIYGEKMYAADHSLAAEAHRPALRWLIAMAALGAAIMVYGLVRVEAWPAVFGWALIFISQLWQIDRFVAIYEEGLRRAAADGNAE